MMLILCCRNGATSDNIVILYREPTSPMTIPNVSTDCRYVIVYLPI